MTLLGYSRPQSTARHLNNIVLFQFTPFHKMNTQTNGQTKNQLNKKIECKIFLELL